MRYNLKHRAWLGHRFYEHIPRECLFNKRQYFGWNIRDLSHNTHTIQTHAHHVSFCNHITGSIVKPWLVHPTAPLLSSLKQSKVKLYVSCGHGGVQQLSVRTPCDPRTVKQFLAAVKQFFLTINFLNHTVFFLSLFLCSEKTKCNIISWSHFNLGLNIFWSWIVIFLIFNRYLNCITNYNQCLHKM